MRSNLWSETIKTPWKAYLEVMRIMTMPLAWIYMKGCGVGGGDNARFYGLPRFFRHKGSTIRIGRNFENRNWRYSNPLGINHPMIITTWTEKAQVIIGDEVGISGGSICASSLIKIGNKCLIGANCTIIDTDFHPIDPKGRRYSREARTKEVVIGDNVFVGMNTIILRGARIGDNSVIGAGSVVRGVVPRDSVYSEGKIYSIAK